MSIVDGWTIDKNRIAYYTFGDKTKDAQVEDFVIEDAIELLRGELNTFKPNLYDSVNKTDTTLTKAIEFFTACLIVKSGNANQTSGNITSENIDGMSIAYGPKAPSNQIKSPIPVDYCGLAQNLVKKYLINNKGLIRSKYRLNVSNPRDKLFNGTYNKYTQSTRWTDQ